ncbi:MAG: hypothetical protein K0R08_677 [Solimicrobium sp.]|jgi:hypothetical protein|nr:hypothetical protein [Solimicrobium sp.]
MQGFNSIKVLSSTLLSGYQSPLESNEKTNRDSNNPQQSDAHCETRRKIVFANENNSLLSKTFSIPSAMMEKYNEEYCVQITFTQEGLEALKRKYRNVRGLPGFVHNTLKGRPTDSRELILKNPNLCTWTPDHRALILPNVYNVEPLRNDPRTAKNTPKGVSSVAWVIDPRLLTKYGCNLFRKRKSRFV